MNSQQSRKGVIALIGFMGTGKSSVGRILANRLGFSFIDLDNEIVQQTGMTISELFKTKGEPYFREIESGILAKDLDSNNTVMACGGGIILFKENRQLLSDKAEVVWLKNSIETSLERCLDGSRPLLETADALEVSYKLYNQREEFYRDASLFSVETENRLPEDIAEEIILKLNYPVNNE